MEFSPLTIGGIVFGLLFLMIATGIPIAFALATVGIISLAFFAGGMQALVAPILYNTVNSFTLTAIPFFVFAGELILKSGLSERLYHGVSRWTSIIPGGLVQSNIAACSIFAAVSGSSVATAATIGTVAIGHQIEMGYDRKVVTGSLAAGGTLGILIPPSVLMIVYGAFQQVSVPELFIAGVIPGVLLAGLFMATIAVTSLARPQMFPEREKLSWGYFPRAFMAIKDIWPMGIFILVIMGSIYGGLMTPTEAAAVACVVALAASAILRKLNLRVLWESSLSTLRTTSFILFILVGANTISNALSMVKFPAALMEVLLGLGVGPYIIWAGVCLIYLILGCFMDGFSAMLITLPVVFPLVTAGLGFDPVWFGILLTILIEAGMITPPVGINVFVIHGIAGGKLQDIFAGMVPFLVCMLVAIVLLTAFPWLVTWLPSTMAKGG
ncbi:MAG: TRAP transporter large permease subunit [Chloroflexi bacterium]|nr:TRAP transporter large permease subunit [Chloroflexota bacterium]